MTGSFVHDRAEHEAAHREADGSIGRWLVAGLLAVAALGAYLRFYRVDAQIVWGDEVHAIHRLLQGSYAQIFGRFHEHDNCIPLTLLLKGLADSVGLSEVTLRLPSLLAGVALIVIGPLLAVPIIDRRAAFLFGSLLAISPEMIYFSRYARPYMIATLLVFVAVFALLRWSCTGRRSFAILYAACGALAIWFHLLAAPAILAPLAAAVPFTLLRREGEDRRRWMRTLFLAAGGLATGLALLLAIPVWNGSDALLDKVGQSRPTWHTIRAALISVAGFRTRGPGGGLTWVFWAGTAAGVLLLLRRSRFAALTLLAASTVQVASVVILSPNLVHLHDTFLRYMSWLIPFVLLFVAVALSAAVPPYRRPGRRTTHVAAIALGAGIVAALLQLGTWRCTYATGSNFPTKSSLRGACLWGRPPGSSNHPAVYDLLAGLPGRFPVVETPWFLWWEDKYGAYQEVHGKDLLLGFGPPVDGRYTVPHFNPEQRSLRFGRFVDLLDATQIEKRGVRYVLFHKDLPREMRFTTHLFDSRSDVHPTIDLYRGRYGDPVFEDHQVAMFEVDRDLGERTPGHR